MMSTAKSSDNMCGTRLESIPPDLELLPVKTLIILSPVWRKGKKWLINSKITAMLQVRANEN